ncbi:hypothetical protein O6H91_Y219200 [Diphasiastrum complanatum]|nr:hypothetical protein O6H91_Y219200 [Diphasiastrum complanatum]
MNVGTACTAEEDRPWLHLRREPFEHGLLPLPSLMHLDGIDSLRSRLLSHAANHGRQRVETSDIAAALSLPETQAHLVLDTLASVLPDDGIHADPLARAPIDSIDSVGANIDDLIIFLYIQNYRKLVPRPYRDAAAVGEIWPSTSAFDRFLPSLSPLQVSKWLFIGCYFAWSNLYALLLLNFWVLLNEVVFLHCYCFTIITKTDFVECISY